MRLHKVFTFVAGAPIPSTMAKRTDAEGDRSPRTSRLGSFATAFLRTQRWRRLCVLVAHLALWCTAWVLALDLRFEGDVPPGVLAASARVLTALVIARLILFVQAGLFDGIFRYSGLPELKKIVVSTTAASAISLVIFYCIGQHGVPRSLFAGEWLASVVAIGGMRMAIRTAYEGRRGPACGTATLIIGAGDAGESLVREFQRMRDGVAWKVVGFLDDDASKRGRVVHGVRVLGPADEPTLRATVRRLEVKLVVLAMPTAAGPRVRDLVTLLRRLGVRTQTVPSLAERLSGEAIQTVREVKLEDLLGRDPVELDIAQVEGFLKGKVVLITGAGGSIGSELARQVLRFKPHQLLLLDHDENAVFFLERELRAEFAADYYPSLLKPLIVDITNSRRVAWVFETFQPEVVLHAAAHKHVAMMEGNVCEAAWNNVFGTQTVAEAAHNAGAEAFVLISTDKAVNPTSIMGTTKRVCEMVVQHIARESDTRFASVRFGNVLGSNGSVVPIFREQIARGGPVTVTHPEVTRYFMTIPEAAQLVLQAGALGGSGEIFLLDMGKPVKIVDLARDLIELSGFVPGVDIEIHYSGLKPGEKLFEEMLLSGEGSASRPHPKIVAGRVQRMGAADFTRSMNVLARAIRMNDERELRGALAALVPEATLAKMAEQGSPVRSIRPERIRQRSVVLEQDLGEAFADGQRVPAPGEGSRRVGK